VIGREERQALKIERSTVWLPDPRIVPPESREFGRMGHRSGCAWGLGDLEASNWRTFGKPLETPRTPQPKPSPSSRNNSRVRQAALAADWPIQFYRYAIVLMASPHRFYPSCSTRLKPLKIMASCVVSG
jgi:hypothetical protein